MLLVAPVRPKHRIAMTDGAAAALRHREAQRAALDDPRGDARRLLGAHPDRARARRTRATTRCSTRFHALTGCPVLVNTSFNVRGEPIVCTPEDAYRCFMRTEMDALVLGSFVLRQEEAAARSATTSTGRRSSSSTDAPRLAARARHGARGRLRHQLERRCGGAPGAQADSSGGQLVLSAARRPMTRRSCRRCRTRALPRVTSRSCGRCPS